MKKRSLRASATVGLGQRPMKGTGLFVALVVWVLLAPVVRANTTPFPGDGDTKIESNGSPEVRLAWCYTTPPLYDCDVTHEDGTPVDVTMTADWLDLRSSPAQERVHRFFMKATYAGAVHGDWHNASTFGNDGGYHLLKKTVDNVSVNTYMIVLYNASIYNPITKQTLGYLEGTSLFHFHSP